MVEHGMTATSAGTAYDPPAETPGRRSGRAIEQTVGDVLCRERLTLALVAAGFVGLFWPTLRSLVGYWLNEPDFSHAVLIPFISGAILYAHRRELAALPARRCGWGLALLGAALALFFLGRLLLSPALERLAMLALIVAVALYAFGPALLLRKPFPFLFLFLSVPPPFYHSSSLRLALGEWVTRITSNTLFLFGKPAFAAGNILEVGNAQFGVTDACSGVRSLMAITATVVLCAYLWNAGPWKGALLALMAVPITLAANVFRLLAITLTALIWDLDLATGRAHDALGLACFGLSLLGTWVAWRFIDWFFRFGPAAPPVMAPTPEDREGP